MQAPHYSVIMCIMKMAELLLLMGLLILSFDALAVYGAISIGCYWIPAGNQDIVNCPNYSTNMTCSSGDTIQNITVNARYNTTCPQNDASCTEACCQMNSTDTNITLDGNVTSDIVLFCSDKQHCTAWWDVLTFSEDQFSTTNKRIVYIYAEYDCITGTTVSISTPTSSTSTGLNVTTPSDNSTTSSATNVAASVTTESTAATSTTTESRKSSTQAEKDSDTISLPLVIGPSAAGFVLIIVVILVVVVCCRTKDGDVTKEKKINQDVLERNENSEILNNVDNESLSSYDEITNAKRESANRISAESLYARVDDPGLQASGVSTVNKDMDDLQERKQNNKRSTKRDSYDHIELKGNTIKINPQLDTDNEDYSHLVNSKNRVAVDSYSHVQIHGNGTVKIGQHIGVGATEDEDDDYSHLHDFQCDTNTTGSRNTDSIYNVTTNIDNARHDREYIGTNNTEGIYNHLMTSNGNSCEANYKPTENDFSSSHDEGIVADCTEDDPYTHVHEHDIGTPELDMHPCTGVMPLTKGSYIKHDVDDSDVGKIPPDGSPIQNDKRGVQVETDVQHGTQFAYQMATPIKDEHIIVRDSADKSSYNTNMSDNVKTFLQEDGDPDEENHEYFILEQKL